MPAGALSGTHQGVPPGGGLGLGLTWLKPGSYSTWPLSSTCRMGATMAARRSKPSHSLFIMACGRDGLREPLPHPLPCPRSRTPGLPGEGPFQPGVPRLTWATAEVMSSPPAPPITSFDPWAALTRMEGTMDDGGRSPGTGDGARVTRSPAPSRAGPPPLSPRTSAQTGAGRGGAPGRGRQRVPRLPPWPPLGGGPRPHRGAGPLQNPAAASSTGPGARC